MSFCSQRLLRFRFSAGLPSCPPQCRLRIGHWSRQGILSRPVRYTTNDAVKSNSVEVIEVGAPDEKLETPAASHPVCLFKHPDNSPSSSHHDNQETFQNGLDQNNLRNHETDASPHQPPAELASALEQRFGISPSWYTALSLQSLCEECEYSSWQSTVKKIFSAHNSGKDVQSLDLHLELTDDNFELLKKLRTDSLGDFRQAWDEMDSCTKATLWLRLSLWLLQNSPELALEFCLVTSQNPRARPSLAMLSECLGILHVFHSHKLKRWRLGKYTYQSVLETCLGPHQWLGVRPTQKAMRLYLKTTDISGVYLGYNLLVMMPALKLKHRTYLCLTYCFTKFGHIDQALELLESVRRLDHPVFHLNFSLLKRCYSKLLTFDSVVDGPQGRNFRILPRLLEMGIKPDRDMMNVVLSNAYKTGDPQLGADMLSYMHSQGLKLDSYSYLTLLKEAVSREDRDRVDQLIKEIEPRGHIFRNPWIASKVFHAHFVFNVKHHWGSSDNRAAFYSLLDMYNKLHDITPLKELSIIPPEYTPPRRGKVTPPSLIALYLMIATYLRCHKRVAHAERVYTHFRSLVLQGHETIAPLAATDHTYNEFLVTFRKDPRGLRPAVRLVEDMLQSSKEVSELDPENEGNGTAIAHAIPTVRTWTLLLSAFIFNGQLYAAEKVKEMMARHAVGYNHVTWNTIISSYVTSGNIPQLAKAIRDMEDHGFTPDEYTLKTLRYLRDPERLWVAIEELDQKSAPLLDLETTPESESVTSEDTEYGYDDLVDLGLHRLQERKAASLTKPN